MPVLMVGAGRDLLVPPVPLRRLIQVNQSDRNMLEIVKNAYHGFDTEREMSRLTENSARWLVQTGLIEAVKKPLTELSASDKLI